jgi:type VI secretion system secreted protein VgrG
MAPKHCPGGIVQDTEFTFACEDLADSSHQLRVVRFHGREALSTLYRYELVLLAKSSGPEIDPHDLIQRRATLRIVTQTVPAYRVVHGIITEAEEMHSVNEGMLYRVVIEPPLVRAAHRKRCRIFLEKTLRQILQAVLEGDANLHHADGATVDADEGDAGFAPAAEVFTFRIADISRFDSVAARPYVVQYGESDFAFVSRLLEEEGISYHFENGQEKCLLVISDQDHGRARLDPFLPLAGDIAHREIVSIQLGSRLRPTAVFLDDYNWRKPALDMLSEKRESARAGQDLFDYGYPGGYADTPTQGTPLATARLERYDVEAEYAVVRSRARPLFAGAIFRLDHAKNHYDGEYLVTRLEARGHQEGGLSQGDANKDGPYIVTIECARRGRNGVVAESHFRPALVTPKPRIVGSQTAFVTADPSSQGAEINVGGPDGGEIGCVRLRFHWDREERRLAKEPSSCWVRVSQVFAGIGQGAVFHPRVGVEAIVDFIDGDPDRPIITGRVYNGANRPPNGPESPTKSSMKTFTSPHDGKFNELSFEDKPGSEEVKIHAARDWNSNVGNNRSESVAVDSSSSAGSNRSESTGSDRSTSVGANNSEAIGGNESISVGGNQSISVGANQSTSIGANQTLLVGANQSVAIGANQDVSVGADLSLSVGASATISVGSDVTTSIGAASTTTVGAASTTTIGAAQTTTVGGSDTFTASGPQTLHSDAMQTVTAPTQTISADGEQTLNSMIHAVNAGVMASRTAGALAATDAPVTIITGDAVLVLTGAVTVINGASISINGSGVVAINGGTVDIKGGGAVSVKGGNIDMSAGVIKLN